MADYKTNSVTSGSTLPVTSGAVYSALNNYLKVSSSSIAQKGYISFGNKLKIAWGVQGESHSVDGGQNWDGASISFGVTFTSAPSIVISHYSGNQFNMTARSITTTSFTPVYRNVNTSTSASTTGCRWIAIGY